jgi:hypothetical protein
MTTTTDGLGQGARHAADGAAPSLWRAWWYLVVLSGRRQARARQMVWIALGLLAFTGALLGVATAGQRWGIPPFRVQWAEDFHVSVTAVPNSPAGDAVDNAVIGAYRALLEQADLRKKIAFLGFSRFFVFSLFLSFLLPLWSLSFATESIGGDRETNSLVWLLTRPLPRWAIYLAKFAALLPWSLGLNVGGFGLLCLLGGAPGRLAFYLFWPSVLWATLAFSALFHFLGAAFRRPAVVGILYTFFLEALLGNMPGYLKRVSVGFYTRCLMFEAAETYDVQPEKPSVYLPVDGFTAEVVLAGATVGLLVLGAVWFARSQYHDAG